MRPNSWDRRERGTCLGWPATWAGLRRSFHEAGKNQGDPKKMASSPKEVEEDSDDEEMSDEEDESSGEEVIIPQKKGKKATTTPGKVMVSPTEKLAVVIPGKEAAITPAKAIATPGKKEAATPDKGARNDKNAKKKDGDEEDDGNSEEEDEDEFEPVVMKAAAVAPFLDDEDDDKEDDSEEEPMEIAPAKGKKVPLKAVPVKAKSTENEDEENDDKEDKDEDEVEVEVEVEVEEEEDHIKKTPDKQKKKMAKQKTSPETKKQKLEAEPPVTFKLFVGNLNFNKTAAELKTGLREFFAKNELTVVGVRVSSSRRFGYVNFKSVDDQEKALELSETKVLGYEIKLKKPKGKETKKDRNAKTLLIKNLPSKVTEHELKEVFEDAFQIRFLSNDGISKRIAYIDFRSQADAERTLEEKQGTEIGGLAIVLEHVGEKNQGQEDRARKNRSWRGKQKIEQESHTFQEKWERAYFFVEVKNVPMCLICKESLSVSKEYNLRCHYETNHSRNLVGYTEKMRDKKLSELKKRLKLEHDLLLNVNKITDAAMKCSYVLREKIARASKPLTDGAFIKECLLSAAEILCPEQRQVFANINLTGNIAEQHVANVTESLQDTLQEKAKSFVAFSIAAHESIYINNTPQLAVFIRGVDETFDVTEELLDMVPLTGTTSGNDLFLCIEKSLRKFDVDWSKLVSVSTDGNSATVGVKQLVTKLKSKVSGLCKDIELKSVHGLFLQESLCAKKLQMDHVMDIVIYTITWLHSHGSTHRKFSALFSELDTQYGNLSYLELKWLSRGMVLKQFFELLEEIDFFMSSKGKSVPQLCNKDWVKDLAFLVDIMTYMVTQMYHAVRSFLAKLCLWETHLARNNLVHFPTLRLVSENESDGLNYIPKIKELKTEFQKRFSDFKLYENELILFSSPFSININNVNEELQMEVIELQHNTILKTKYDDVGIPEFFKYLGNSYPKYKNHCAKILSMFGSSEKARETLLSQEGETDHI
ncbi:hypothetical protein QTO34_002771 [Cnephaeus nilssonii]|uniref:RRM domain-containing protein n=1 Tax=Cnephaeus nilssonii TaxID=3371016 RepID=A0AA40LKG4_CNENI|nr:hypothetical protein QTO34_002771 [Eptesicus nilssonii]